MGCSILKARLVVMHLPLCTLHLPRLLRFECLFLVRKLVIICSQCRHFGEAPAPCSSMCDCCKRGSNAVTHRDVTEAARSCLTLLSRWPGAEQRATLLQLINAWRSDKVCCFCTAYLPCRWMSPCVNSLDITRVCSAAICCFSLPEDWLVPREVDTTCVEPRLVC